MRYKCRVSIHCYGVITSACKILLISFSTKPFKCAVKSCTNTFNNFREKSTYPYKFHNFPLDVNLRMFWMLKCGLDNNTDISNVKVCSDHFSLDDYVRNYKEEFLNPKFRRTLKKDAIPSKNCVTNSVFEIVTEISENTDIEPKITENITNNISSDNVKRSRVVQKVSNDLEIPKKTRSTLIMKRNKLFKQEYKLKKEIDELERLINIYKKEKTSIEEYNCTEPQNLLTKLFSPSQIELLAGKEKKVYWTNDDLARAFTIRQMGGRKCYLYLKNVLNVPLPALSCVQKWAASSDN